jgi:predicted RNA-binding protein
MENVTRLEVEGDHVILTSLLGQREELQGRVSSVSFMDGRVVIDPWPR